MWEQEAKNPVSPKGMMKREEIAMRLKTRILLMVIVIGIAVAGTETNAFAKVRIEKPESPGSLVIDEINPQFAERAKNFIALKKDVMAKADLSPQGENIVFRKASPTRQVGDTIVIREGFVNDWLCNPPREERFTIGKVEVRKDGAYTYIEAANEYGYKVKISDDGFMRKVTILHFNEEKKKWVSRSETTTQEEHQTKSDGTTVEIITEAAKHSDSESITLRMTETEFGQNQRPNRKVIWEGEASKKAYFKLDEIKKAANRKVYESTWRYNPATGEEYQKIILFGAASISLPARLFNYEANEDEWTLVTGDQVSEGTNIHGALQSTKTSNIFKVPEFNNWEEYRTDQGIYVHEKRQAEIMRDYKSGKESWVIVITTSIKKGGWKSGSPVESTVERVEVTPEMVEKLKNKRETGTRN